jgi:hypothetical protein
MMACGNYGMMRHTPACQTRRRLEATLTLVFGPKTQTATKSGSPLRKTAFSGAPVQTAKHACMAL